MLENSLQNGDVPAPRWLRVCRIYFVARSLWCWLFSSETKECVRGKLCTTSIFYSEAHVVAFLIFFYVKSALCTSLCILLSSCVLRLNPTFGIGCVFCVHKSCCAFSTLVLQTIEKGCYTFCTHNYSSLAPIFFHQLLTLILYLLSEKGVTTPHVVTNKRYDDDDDDDYDHYSLNNNVGLSNSTCMVRITMLEKFFAGAC